MRKGNSQVENTRQGEYSSVKANRAQQARTWVIRPSFSAREFWFCPVPGLPWHLPVTLMSLQLLLGVVTQPLTTASPRKEFK